ncbi:MAG: MoxR family ATPase [Lachnospiraceae bacterium]|nr:MoxR family ATPase [Lachnospiraceae bacterium]
MSEELKQNGFTGSSEYVASEELMASVNVAIALKKPLLIKGEPGTGKTMLAEAVAKSLGKKLIIWNIKSTTKAQEGLYVYDTIQRLYDGQFGEEGVDDISRYIKLGKLGEAFDSDEQVVLLIDEIDKADLEFPNDLLWELDQMEFYINETKRTVKAKHRPIVIITSNAEKELPDAFLRRCIFHYIDFPNDELMEEIVKVHYPDVEENLLKSAMNVFYNIRSLRDIRKKPSTSELIDWINALQIGGISADKIKSTLPFIGVVVKKDEDLETVRHNANQL